MPEEEPLELEKEIAAPTPPVGEPKPEAAGFGTTFLQRLKDLYYSLEDKYYLILDKINEKIPIYKIIDPIDEVIPSFLLFIILMILLLLFGLAFLLSLLSPFGAEASFQVVDDEMNFLPEVDVTVGYDGKQETVSADAFGEFEVTLRDRNILVEVDKEGFKPYSQSLEPKIDETNYIILEEEVKTKTIRFRIQNQQGNIIEEAIDLEFSCTGTTKPNNKHIDAAPNAGEFDLVIFLSCGILTTDVKNVVGYRNKRVTHNVATTNTILIILEPKPVYGQLSVLVMDPVSGQGIEGAGLKVYKLHSPSDILEKQGSSDATGTKAFSEIVPGTYYVRAEKEEYETEKSDNVEIVAGQLTYLELELSPGVISKKILVKFVDKNTASPIQGARATLFEDNSELTETETTADGIAEFINLDEDKNYSIVAAHSEYVTEVAEDLPLINANETTEKIVEMERATEVNSGKVEVVVKNYVGEAVAGASVYLYNKNYDFFVGKGSTNSDGLITFNNMPPGSYYSYASKLDSDGKSSVGNLTAGKTLRLNVVLVLGEGRLLVKVYDLAEKKVNGAKVEFYDSLTNEKLAEQITADGKTAVVSFKINKSPYIIVKKAGYFPTITPEQVIQLNKTRTVEVILEADGSFDQFDIELVDVLKENGKKATRLDDDETFLFEFKLKVPDDNFSAIVAVIRTGLQENSKAEDSVVVVKDVQKSIASTAFSGCYDEADDYADCNITAGDCKQAVSDYGSLERGVYYFRAETYIKEVADDAESSTYIEVRYGAKGTDVEGNEIVKGMYVWRNNIGPIVPGIFFEINLEDLSKGLYSAPVSVREEPLLILSEKEYVLHYKIHNQTDEDYDNVDLTLVNNNAALDLAYSSLTIGSFESGLLLENSVGFSTPTPSELTKLTFELNIDRPDSNVTVQFIVSALLDLQIDFYPAELAPGQINNVVAVVSDTYSGAKVPDATINAYFYDWQADQNIAQPTMTAWNSGKTNGKGQYLLKFPSHDYDREQPPTYWITAEKVAYRKGQGKITVGAGPALLMGVLECVAIDNNELYVSRNNSTQFAITNDDCGEDVEIVLSTCVEGTAYCTAGSSDIEINSPAQLRFIIPNGETETVEIDTKEYLGVHPVFVEARLVGDALWHLIDMVHIFISPTSSGYLNCLQIKENKYIYDVFHRDENGTVINKCYVGYDDEEYINIDLKNGEDIFLNYVIASISGETKYVDFNIMNMGVHGERYALMTIEDYIKGGS